MTRRISLTIKEKIEVIRNLENDKKQSEIVAEKGISKLVVSRIWKDKESVLKSYSDLPVSIKKRTLYSQIRIVKIGKNVITVITQVPVCTTQKSVYNLIFK